MSTKRQKYQLTAQRVIGIPLILLVLCSGQVSCLSRMKKIENLIKKSEKKVANLIKMSHKTLIVFSVKVRCPVQKVLSFNVSKELFN